MNLIMLVFVVVIVGLYIESIRMMKKFKDSTDIEIEKPIKNWMGQATPRLKKLAQKNEAIINISVSDV